MPLQRHNILRRQFLRQLGIGTASICGAAGFLSLNFSPLTAIAADDSPEATAAEMLSSKTLEAIGKGLKYLASRQQNDGAFGSGGYSRNVGVCALAGMAFLSSGSTPGRGPYGKHVDKCINFLLQHTEESGFISVANTPAYGPMYGHGFATLFLSECYGMSRRSDLRPKLSKAVELIVSTQNKEGGWRYQPQRADADISVTICQIMALRAARNAGLQVPADTISKCVDYVKKCQLPDGGFMYMLDAGGTSAFPRSAAGVVALHNAGIYEGREVEKGLKYLMSFVAKPDDIRRDDTHYFYGHYYAVQAMWQAGGKYWAKWYPAIRDSLLKRQQENGSWMDPICVEYGTAMACIILQMPNNYLPIFQR